MDYQAWVIFQSVEVAFHHVQEKKIAANGLFHERETSPVEDISLCPSGSGHYKTAAISPQVKMYSCKVKEYKPNGTDVYVLTETSVWIINQQHSDAKAKEKQAGVKPGDAE